MNARDKLLPCTYGGNGITIPEVTRYCRLGKIPGAKKVGKYWFVEKSVLRNYMEGQA